MVFVVGGTKENKVKEKKIIIFKGNEEVAKDKVRKRQTSIILYRVSL